MAKPKKIIIDIQNLTEKEQLELLTVLFKFATEKLPHSKLMNCYIAR